MIQMMSCSITGQKNIIILCLPMAVRIVLIFSTELVECLSAQPRCINVLSFTRLWSQRGQKSLVNSVLLQCLPLTKKRRKLNRYNAVDCFKWCDYCVISVCFDVVGHESMSLSIHEVSMHTYYIDLNDDYITLISMILHWSQWSQM